MWGVSVLWGSISPTGSLFEKVRKAAKGPDPIDLSRDVKSDVSVQRFFSSQIHFCLDSDRPTEEAVQALRIMCARELPSFMTPGRYLVAGGHADTIGNEKYNKDLSERRAKNIIQAIRDILGPKFNLKDDEKHIKPIPRGE